MVCIEKKDGLLCLFAYKSISNIPENLMYFLLMFHFVNCFENSTVWQILQPYINQDTQIV